MIMVAVEFFTFHLFEEALATSIIIWIALLGHADVFLD